jgi:hypothetical protein
VRFWLPDEGIDVESGGWPVHTPCPTRRALNPGGQTPRLRLLFIIFISYILLFISFINKDVFLIKVKFINNIISLNIKLNKRII